MVNGFAEFGIDVRRPGMLFAAVSQSPVFGGQVRSYDEAAAFTGRFAPAIGDPRFARSADDLRREAEAALAPAPPAEEAAPPS